MNYPPSSYRTAKGDLIVINEIQAIYVKDRTSPDGYNRYLKLKGTDRIEVQLTPEDETAISRILNWDYNNTERGE